VIAASKMGKFKMLAQVLTVALLIVSSVSGKPPVANFGRPFSGHRNFGPFRNCVPPGSIFLGAEPLPQATGKYCFIRLAEQCSGW